VALEGERVLGYAKSGEFRERPAYASTREVSVYVAENARRGGVGGALYGELLRRLEGRGLRLAVGGVTQPNAASDRLHLAHGFTEVGTFHAVGVKFGKPWDVRWYERPLKP
jgi:phosphinothricin acetyltransferase